MGDVVNPPGQFGNQDSRARRPHVPVHPRDALRTRPQVRLAQSDVIPGICVEALGREVEGDMIVVSMFAMIGPDLLG